LELKIGNFVLGGNELLSVNRDRLEWSYTLPFIPLYLAENAVGDRDNSSVGFDIQYFLLNRARIFAELFFDDLLSPTDLFRDYYGNKYAFSIGVEIPDLFISGSNIELEYSRVEPWLYTHHTKNNQMQHYGALTGSHIPANSQIFHLRYTQVLNFPLSVSGEYSFYQHQHLDRGSSVFDVHDPFVEPTTKKFLGEYPETRNTFDVHISYFPIRLLELNVSCGYFLVDNWESQEGEYVEGWNLGGEVFLRY
jgi:hypothetical protein